MEVVSATRNLVCFGTRGLANEAQVGMGKNWQRKSHALFLFSWEYHTASFMRLVTLTAKSSASCLLRCQGRAWLMQMLSSLT